MNKEIKKDVLDFMLQVDTSKLNTNNFILDFFRYKYWNTDEYKIRNGASFESISRSRRYWLAQEKEWLNLWLSRSDKTKDTDAIREIAASRSDTQKLLEIRQGRLSQAVQLLEQDLHRKPDYRWLHAILLTLVAKVIFDDTPILSNSLFFASLYFCILTSSKFKS